MKYFVLTVIGILLYPKQSQKSFIQILSNNKKARYYVVVPNSKLAPERYYITTNDKLYLYYSKYGTKDAATYGYFISKLIEGEISIDLNTNNYFILKKEKSLINKEYKEHGLNYIRSKYLKYIGNEWRNKETSSEVNDTLIKIMVENYFIVYFSEYSGFLSFKEHLAR